MHEGRPQRAGRPKRESQITLLVLLRLWCSLLDPLKSRFLSNSWNLWVGVWRRPRFQDAAKFPRLSVSGRFDQVNRNDAKISCRESDQGCAILKPFEVVGGNAVKHIRGLTDTNDGSRSGLHVTPSQRTKE